MSHYDSLYNMKKIVLSPTTSSPIGLYGYGNAGRAASSQAWHALGDHGFGLRGVGFKSQGNPLLKVSVSDEIG